MDRKGSANLIVYLRCDFFSIIIASSTNSLCQVVCNLQADPSTRVIYIPDCGGWGKGSVELGIKFLIDAVVLAFANDPHIIAKCEDFDPEKPNEIEAFLVVRFLNCL